MNKTSKQLHIRSKICVVAIIILSILLLYNVVTLLDQLKEDSDAYENTKSSMEYAMRDRDYIDLISRVKYNEVHDFSVTPETKEYVALAYYYDALVYYQIYKDYDQELAQYYLKRMEDNYKELSTDRFIEEAHRLKSESLKW